MAKNYLVILLSLYIVVLNGNGQDNIIIEEVPQSLLIPTGHVGTFSCKSCCTHCYGLWVINDSPSQESLSGHASLESMGFIFSESYFNKSNQLCHAMMVTIIATESVNASSITCEYCLTVHQCSISDEATLLVIASSPVTPNPSVTQTNQTHLTLLWSPPFLWPGQRINHYHVFFITKRECVLTEYRVNSSYSDQIVSLTINHSKSPILCVEFEIFVSAIGIDASELQTFNITGQIMPPISDAIEMSSLEIINISVYFAAADGEPAIIEMYIKVPICHSSPLNYTISFGSVVIESGQTQHDQHESGFNKTVVNKFIKADLQANRSYWMNVTTNIYSQDVHASDQRTFNTSGSVLKHAPLNATESITSYQIAVIIFGLFIAILLFLALIILVIIYWNRRVKKKKCISSRNGIHNGMVVNPIYDGSSGPVYDSIMTQPERIQSTGSDQKDNMCITNQHYESLNAPNTNKTADTDRYIGQPIQPSLNSFHTTTLDCHTEMQRVRCDSTSASATGMTGLKSNGQPRNKLGLTLSLDWGDSTVAVGDNNLARIMHRVPNVSSSEHGNEEEPYAIMNPARSLIHGGQEEKLPTV